MSHFVCQGNKFSAIAVGSSLDLLPKNGVKQEAKRQNQEKVKSVVIQPRRPRDKWSFLDKRKAVGILERNSMDMKELQDKSYGALDKELLTVLSQNIYFEEEVVHDRSPFSAPYNESDVVFQSMTPDVNRNLIKSGGRHNSRCPDVQHMPCHLKFSVEKGVSRIVNSPVQKSEVFSSTQDDTHQLSPHEDTYDDQTSHHPQKPPIRRRAHSWDEYLMTLLSKDTANLIIKQYTSGQQTTKLQDILKRHSLTLEKRAQVQKDDQKLLLGDLTHTKIKGKHDSEEQKLGSLNKEHDDSSKKESVSVNVVHQETGSTKQQRLSFSNRSKLKASLNGPLKTVLQPSYPVLPSLWTTKTENKGKKTKSADDEMVYKNKVVRGLKKWVDYPASESVANSEMQILTSSPVSSNLEINLQTVKQHKENENLVKIADDWRSQWFLEKKWEDSTPEEIVTAMQSINDHTRLAAVSACSKAALIQSRKAEAKHSESLSSSHLQNVGVCDEILQEILKLLDDICNEVRIAAAISLFTLNRGNQKAKMILLQALKAGGPPDKWAAAQCLAYSSCTDDVVLKELVHNVNSSDVTKSFKAAKLLSDLSQRTGSIQYMLAEQLNSNSWRDRATACHLLPLLKEGISKDISSKLSHLMWYDWSKEVRVSAARALGRTGNGKLVHDKLKERLTHGNESEKADALRKIANLGIITGRLLPQILNCLQDDYVSVRMEAIKTASAIKLSDDDALDILIKLASEDRSWKVKAFSLKALGQIGRKTDAVRSILLWSLRYENQPAVRAEACHSIGSLRYGDDETVKILQDRVIVEESDLVKREVVKVLTWLGIQPTGDLSMQIAVQNEVKRLCNRNNVATHILQEEENQRYLLSYQKYIERKDQEKDEYGTSNGEAQSEDDVCLDYTLEKPVTEPAWFNALSKEFRSRRENVNGIFSLCKQQSVFSSVELQSSSDSESSIVEDNYSDDDNENHSRVSKS